MLKNILFITNSKNYTFLGIGIQEDVLVVTNSEILKIYFLDKKIYFLSQIPKYTFWVRKYIFYYKLYKKILLVFESRKIDL